MPSPYAMHRFWVWLNKKWPDDQKVNTEIFNYVNKFISPFFLDGRPKKKVYKRHEQKRLKLLENYYEKNGKPFIVEEEKVFKDYELSDYERHLGKTVLRQERIDLIKRLIKENKLTEKDLLDKNDEV